MTDPKHKQGTSDKSRREAEGQKRTGETERQGQRNPLPREEGDTRSERETRRM